MSEAENREQDWTSMGVGVWGSRGLRSLQSRRILQRDPWLFFFRNDVSPPSWTLILYTTRELGWVKNWYQGRGWWVWNRGEEGEKKIQKIFSLLSTLPSPPFPAPPPLVFSWGAVDGYATLMSPNKSETAVHGCHCPGDMAVRMREVLARPWVWVSVCVPLALSLSCLFREF